MDYVFKLSNTRQQLLQSGLIKLTFSRKGTPVYIHNQGRGNISYFLHVITTLGHIKKILLGGRYFLQFPTLNSIFLLSSIIVIIIGT